MTLFNWSYTITGLLGIAIWITRRVIPWLKPRFSWMYFKVRFNRLFIGGFLLGFAIYGLAKAMPYQLLVFTTSQIVIGFGSIYGVLLFIDWSVDKTEIRFDTSMAFIAFAAFIYLTSITVKDYIFPDLETKTEVHVFSLSENMGEPILVGDYHEYNPFTYRSDGDFLIEIVDNTGSILLQQKLPKNTATTKFYSVAETGKMYIRPISAAKTNKINLAVVHRFDWQRLGIRNHWFLRHAIPYSFLVTFLLLFTPKYQYRRLLMDNEEKGLGKRLSSDIDERLHDLVYNRRNPVGVLQTVAEQLFDRLNYTQLRWTVVSRAKLYKALREAFAAEKDLDLLDLEYEVKEERLKTISAKQQRKRRRYEGTETKAEAEVSDAADEFYQYKDAFRFKSKEALEKVYKKRKLQILEAWHEDDISEKEKNQKIAELEQWKKNELEDLESRL